MSPAPTLQACFLTINKGVAITQRISRIEKDPMKCNLKYLYTLREILGTKTSIYEGIEVPDQIGDL